MEHDDLEGKVWGIPNQDEYGRLNGVMFGMENLCTFPCRGERRLNQSSSVGFSMRPGSEPVKMSMTKKKSWLYGRFQRKLVNEALDTFLSIQRAAGSGGGGAENKEFKVSLVKKSKEYRSMIQACVSEMSVLLESLEGAQGETDHPPAAIYEDPSSLRESCHLLYKMELILGLAEIVFIDTQPGGVVLSPLLNWVRLHFPQCRHRMAEALSTAQPSSYPDYWEACYGLVLQGLLDEARDLLSRHPDSNKDSFLSMDEILRKMPVFVTYSGVSESEFSVRWLHWQAECESRLHKGEFSSSARLETIAKILCGDLATLVSLPDVLDTWYHLMVSFLLYSNPAVKLHRLASAAQEGILAFGAGSDTPISHLDQILVAILEIKDCRLLKECQMVLDNLWFTAHLSDLLYHALDKDSDKYLKELRESLLVDYGSELVSHPSLWQIGLVYLDTSGPGSSGPCVEAVLERIPLTSDKKAFKVIQAATERSADNVAIGVCRVMGRRKLREGLLGAAIWWGVRSQDAAFTSHLAHKILHKYMEEGRFLSSSLLDHLGPAMLLSDTLTFLSKYREFHSLYQKGQTKEAASLLVSLIASRLAPQYFWPVLLEDSLPLLQCPEPVISADQTYKLMYCLHNLSINPEDSPISPEKKKQVYASFLDKEADVRLALTNNLARAIVQEGTLDY